MLELFAYYADAIGIIGVILTLIAFYLINVGKVTSDNLYYLMLNLIGSCMLFYSLMFSWNLASVLIEIAWILISLIGIYRYVKLRNTQKLLS
jgi:hypothetical protein